MNGVDSNSKSMSAHIFYRKTMNSCKREVESFAAIHYLQEMPIHIAKVIIVNIIIGGYRMLIGGTNTSQSNYYHMAIRTESQLEFANKTAEGEAAESIARQMKDKLVRDKGEVQAIPEKGKGAPYSYLADENGIVEYKGVIFRCDNEKRELCLGDMSNRKNVIRIPLSGGGCLMVNRDNIDQLGKAIGMFSPEDINNILRALKLDAKIQEMKKEMEEMEDGIGKSSAEQNADSAKEAAEASEDEQKARGFHGYEEKEDGKPFVLEEWQFDTLTKEIL